MSCFHAFKTGKCSVQQYPNVETSTSDAKLRCSWTQRPRTTSLQGRSFERLDCAYHMIHTGQRGRRTPGNNSRDRAGQFRKPAPPLPSKAPRALQARGHNPPTIAAGRPLHVAQTSGQRYQRHQRYSSTERVQLCTSTTEGCRTKPPSHSPKVASRPRPAPSPLFLCKILLPLLLFLLPPLVFVLTPSPPTAATAIGTSSPVGWDIAPLDVLPGSGATLSLPPGTTTLTVVCTCIAIPATRRRDENVAVAPAGWAAAIRSPEQRGARTSNGAR